MFTQQSRHQLIKPPPGPLAHLIYERRFCPAGWEEWEGQFRVGGVVTLQTQGPIKTESSLSYSFSVFIPEKKSSVMLKVTNVTLRSFVVEPQRDQRSIYKKGSRKQNRLNASMM